MFGWLTRRRILISLFITFLSTSCVIQAVQNVGQLIVSLAWSVASGHCTSNLLWMVCAWLEVKPYCARAGNRWSYRARRVISWRVRRAGRMKCMWRGRINWDRLVCGVRVYLLLDVLQSVKSLSFLVLTFPDHSGGSSGETTEDERGKDNA